MIKSAAEHKKDITRIAKEERHFDTARRKEQERLENYEYMRDELMGNVLASGMSFEAIHERNGPIVKTLTGYLNKTTLRPRMEKMASVAEIIGMRWTLVRKH